jgi:hypothetical protein
MYAGAATANDVHRRELARDDSGSQRKAAADGGVEALADDVDLAVVEMPVGQHAWIALEKAPSSGTRKLRPKAWPMLTFNVPRGPRRASSTPATPPAATRAGRPPAAGSARRLRSGQRRVLRLEEAHAEIALETRDVLADAGRREAEDRAPPKKLPCSAVCANETRCCMCVIARS